jgi:hypothetical protein
VSSIRKTSELRGRKEITCAIWLVLLPLGFVAPQSRITADMLLRCASPSAKFPAPYRTGYFFTAPKNTNQ